MFNSSKKTKQDKVNDLISYESDLKKILKDRQDTVEQIDSLDIDELNNILNVLYKHKINPKHNIDIVKGKVLKLLNDDIVYNEIWIKESRKKIDKLNKK